MSSCSAPARLRRRSALLGLAALAGCGFVPAYTPAGGALALRDAIAYETPATFEGYRLRERLEDRLGRAEAPRYRLNVRLSVSRAVVAVSSAQETLRFNFTGTADWALRPAAGGAPLAQGQVDGFTGALAADGTVATEATEEDARERLAVLLADQIVARLLAAAPGLP